MAATVVEALGAGEMLEVLVVLEVLDVLDVPDVLDEPDLLEAPCDPLPLDELFDLPERLREEPAEAVCSPPPLVKSWRLR